MRVTRQGWSLLALGVAMVVGGRVFAVWELYVLGSAALVLVALALINTGLARLELHVSRTITPVRLFAGNTARVDVSVVNRGSRTPVLQLSDPVEGTPGAEMNVGPLYKAETANVAYQLPTEHRGVMSVGPLSVRIGDPFGLSSLSIRAAGVHQVTVYPRVHRIEAAPFTVGDDSHNAAPTPNALGRTGDDFYALRQYSLGDDLRRVCWKSTARHDELMVRQDDQPWQGRLTVLLDTRRRSSDASQFELAIEAAASVLDASSRRRDLIRLVTTSSGDSGFAAGGTHLESVMQFLASADPTPAGTLLASRDAMLAEGGGGALVACLIEPSGNEVDEVLRMRKTFASITVVVCRPDAEDGGTVSFPAPGSVVVEVGDPGSFVAAWSSVHGRAYSPSPAVRR